MLRNHFVTPMAASTTPAGTRMKVAGQTVRPTPIASTPLTSNARRHPLPKGSASSSSTPERLGTFRPLGQPDVATREAACQHLGVLIRRYESADADRVREIHAQAFRRIDAPEAVPPEVALFDALVEADDVIPQLSLVAVGPADLVGHVMCSRATVEARAVAALGPISVDPRNQRQGVGLAMMHAVLSAADALEVPLVGLLGSLEYYSRFGFTLAETLGIESPYPELSHHFQVRILAGYDSSISGRFRYAPAFDLV
jgi:putative acetyltransferase